MRTTLLRLATSTDCSARTSIAILLLVLSAVGLCSALDAFVKPLCYDEICTVIMCRLPNASQIWNALDNAADTNPPAFYLTTRFARQLIWDDHLGYRLPSILGLLGTVCCVYAILSRRLNHLSALVGATFVLCTPLAAYASEARPYSLMLFCVSGAIFAWQRIFDSKLYSFFLAITLAAAVSLHYYAILVWPAFILAEISVWLFNRRFRVVVWTALFVGAIPVLVFAKLLFKLRQYYGRNFWAQPSIRELLSAYDWLFNLGGLWSWVLTAGVTGTVAYWILTKGALGSSSRRTGKNSALTIEEGVLILMLLWLPVVGVAAAKMSHGGMSSRYMMPTILGGALAVGCLTNTIPGALKALLLILMLMNYGLSSVSNIKKFFGGSLLQTRVAAGLEVKALFTQHHDPNLPIVISSGLRYLPMAYYTAADSNRRLYAVTDPRAAVRFAGTDSVDLALLVLRRYFPLNVEDYVGFASKHREFFLVSETGGGFDWWPERLSHDGHVLTLLSVVGHTQVFKVTLRQ